jgi:hypothetical protein
MEIETLTEHLEDLATKIEAVSLGLQSASAGLKETLREPETAPAPQLMLPAPAVKKGGKNARCSVCHKFCKSGETIHKKCMKKEEKA